MLEWWLLESALSATLVVYRRVSVLRIRFCSVVVAVERWVCFLQLDVWLGSVMLAPMGDVVFHQMLVQHVDDS